MIISKKTHQVSVFFSALILITLVAACDSSTAPADRHKRAQPTLHRVQVVTAETRAVSLSQTVSGTLEAVTRIRLYNEESGRITKLPYYEGDFVKKGTLLVQMDDVFLKTDLSIATAAREQAKLDLSRLKKLLPKKISTEEEVARARTELNLAIAEEKRQRTRLQRATIKAPVDGLITQRLYEPGDMLAPQSHILTIIDPSALRLKASLAERWLTLITPHQAVKLRIDAMGDQSIDATIVRIHPTVDAATHKGLIEILVNPVPEGASVGQFARADIELTATDRLVIPVHTVHYEPEGAYVYRVIDDGEQAVAEKVYFKQGQQFGSMTEIYSGLSTGDRIVSRGYLGLRDGKKVIVAQPAVD